MKIVSAIAVVFLLLQPLEAEDLKQTKSNLRTRQEFALAMSNIKDGMSEDAVFDHLGKPDDILTPLDTDRIPTVGTTKIWRYGTNGHLTFPTLGSVYFDKGAKVHYIYGSRGHPPDAKVLPEEELRRFLRLIDRASGYDSENKFDPLTIIQIVNALQLLGKEKALTVIDEYLRVSPYYESQGREGIFLVLRVLFEIPANPGYMPRMNVGVPGPSEPEDPRLMPRFPILLIDDVPLLLVSVYALIGKAEPPERHVTYFRKVGKLREKQLSPTNDPLGLLDAWFKKAGWLYDKKYISQDKRRIANQLLNLVDSVYRVQENEAGYKFNSRIEIDGLWKIIQAEVNKQNIHWNAEKDRYTLKNGCYLPEKDRKP